MTVQSLIMALAPGTRLGHYDVTALLGEGGMGQVWQATDTQLNRQVALKILPDAFAADPDRLARFTREAQILASLNHPNIAAIYGIEEAEGTRALVLELVEGPTLADRIAKGPIPLDEVLPIGKQIAEALEAAHGAGVIHRDLKPANIKVREDGTVKVLDFGLAKALAGAAQGVDLSQSPTVTAAATREGVILGTAAYMSPEQARGKPLDKRTDIWAFGCVLFEMLTGRSVFEGDTLSDTIAKVLEHEPRWDTLPRGTPPVVRKLLRRCLDKNPRTRLRDVGDARAEITEAVSTPDADTGAVVASPLLQVWQRPMPLAAGVLLLLLITGLTVWGLAAPRAGPAPLARFLIPLSSDVRQGGRGVAVSPDSANIAYHVNDGLWLRPTNQIEATLVSPIEWVGSAHPFFSHDGQWIGFYDDGQLKKAPVTGGAVQHLFPGAARARVQVQVEQQPLELRSRVNRASRSGSAAKASGRIFSATWRLSWVSVACQTCPMPPSPRRAVTS